MKPITKTYLLLFTCLFLLAACQKEENVPAPYTETVQLIISVPASASTRIGDPGTAVDEGADWNQLAVILAYTDDSKVKTTTITQAEFNALPSYNGNTNYKLLAIDAEPGTVNIYGVTYSSDAANKPSLNCTTNADVQALTISNDYADGDASKFVSVATGYYKDDNGNIGTFEIKEGGTGQVGGTIPTMTLTRLAAKIDIQWDAADAYTEGYTDVKVKDFNYNGTELGRLFPEVTLPTGTTITNPDKQWTFYNTSEISQRNGRVYHYTFPDGEIKQATQTEPSTPNVTFNITATDNNTTTTTKKYTLNFTSPLKQATWYKVNATIKGITGSGNITFGDNSGTSAGG